MHPFARLRSLAALALVLSLILPAFANDNPKKGRVTTNPPAGSYTIEQEIQLGQQAVKEIEKDLPLLPADHPTSKYIAALGAKLAAKAPGYKFPYTFKVVKQKEINAFALPGGPIYVNIGTINAGTEAELAGVMGHEISHVVMRHSARQAAKAAKAQVPLAILGGVLGMGVGGWAGSLAQMGLSIGAGSVFMKYSRDAETEADMVGAQIIYDAGYDPNALVTFFQKLKAQQGDAGGPSFLASHPDPGNRAKNVSSILSRFPVKQYQSADSPEFLAAKKALADVSTETYAQTQAKEPQVTLNRLSAKQLEASPSITFFDHAAFQVAYPDNWQLAGDERSSVNIFPKGGAAANSIAYGVILSGFKPGRGGDNLDEGMRQLVQSIQQTNDGLRPVGNPVNITVDRKPAKAVEMQGLSSVMENGKPLPERIRVVALKGKSGLLLYALMVAPEPDFDILRPTFDRILNTYRLR
jgi:beta-barrel assembly-enhancing protease